MKSNYYPFLFVLVTLLLFSCGKEPILPDVVDETCDVNLGTFQLLKNSLEVLPYAGKQEVQFVNGVGVEATFTIRGGTVFNTDEKIIVESDLENGESIEYCFQTEKSNFVLVSNELQVIFEISITTLPYESALSAGFVGDVLEIFYAPDSSPNEATKVFTKTIDQRTFPQPLTSDLVMDTMNLGGVEFYNVEFMSIPGAHTPLFFNDETGIISFQDESGTFWRYNSIK